MNNNILIIAIVVVVCFVINKIINIIPKKDHEIIQPDNFIKLSNVDHIINSKTGNEININDYHILTTDNKIISCSDIELYIDITK